VTIIAQDEDGLNSSWSEPLELIVSQADENLNDTIVEIGIDNSEPLVNQTIFFNGFECFHPTGAIVSYIWDFGDGFKSDGVNVSHVYKNPGEYVVTLNVLDNMGNSYSETMTVNIASQFDEIDLDNSESETSITFFDSITYVIIGVIIVIFASVVYIIFRDKIELKLINQRIEKLNTANKKPKDKFR
jgi:hypothetical protein